MMNRNHSQYHVVAPSRPRGIRSFLSQRIVVSENEHVVLITDGVAQRTLDTGPTRIRPRRDRVTMLAAVPQLVIVPGQEMLTGDGAGIRATVAATVQITDPLLVVRNGGWRDQFYLQTQLTVRNLVAALSLEELLAARGTLDTDLELQLAPKTEPLGVELKAVAIRDLSIPGELKRAVADVVTARLGGQAALERARGETAALRSLANAAKAVSDNPALLQLRLLQQMEQSTGNTYVLGSGSLLDS